MKVVMKALKRKSYEEFLVRAMQFSVQGELTHISVEGSPNTTWEPVDHFILLPITVHLNNSEEE